MRSKTKVTIVHTNHDAKEFDIVFEAEAEEGAPAPRSLVVLYHKGNWLEAISLADSPTPQEQARVRRPSIASAAMDD